jgi:hypothetical protein
VNKIYDPKTDQSYQSAFGKYITKFCYNVGDMITVNDFATGTSVCCEGIHFCHSIQELQTHNW